MSFPETPDLFTCTTKYRRFDAFWITLLICSFQARFFYIVKPRSSVFVPLLSSFSSIAIGATRGSSLTNEIISSLHLSLFNFILLRIDHSATLSVTSWTLLWFPIGMISRAVVLSMYFHISAILAISNSFMSTRKSDGPSLVP